MRSDDDDDNDFSFWAHAYTILLLCERAGRNELIIMLLLPSSQIRCSVVACGGQ
jgi:hypothetical protein